MTMFQDRHPAANHSGILLSWLHDTPKHRATRHLHRHTKNTLSRFMGEMTQCPTQNRDRSGATLAAELERQLRPSVDLSDASFGMVQAPRPLEARLSALCHAIVGLLSDGDQVITVDVSVHGHCPAALDDALVHAAHELVGNAVTHGMTLRMVGRIEVLVEAGAEQVTMSVIDDGWGSCGTPGRVAGSRVVQMLSRRFGGDLSLHRRGFDTVITMTLPCGVRNAGL